MKLSDWIKLAIQLGISIYELIRRKNKDEAGKIKLWKSGKK